MGSIYSELDTVLSTCPVLISFSLYASEIGIVIVPVLQIGKLGVHVGIKVSYESKPLRRQSLVSDMRKCTHFSRNRKHDENPD